MGGSKEDASSTKARGVAVVVKSRDEARRKPACIISCSAVLQDIRREVAPAAIVRSQVFGVELKMKLEKGIGLALVTQPHLRFTDDLLQNKRKLMCYTELAKATNERHSLFPPALPIYCVLEEMIPAKYRVRYAHA